MMRKQSRKAAPPDTFKWVEIKPSLSGLPHKKLIELVQELYALNVDNRRFLTARYAKKLSHNPDQGESKGLAYYRALVKEPFFPDHGDGMLELRPARKAISDYYKATGDRRGSLELMLYYVEMGTKFTNEYGDIDEPFYNSMESMMDKFYKTIRQPDCQKYYPQFQERMLKLVRQTRHIGWGYGDAIAYYVGEIEKFFEKN